MVLERLSPHQAHTAALIVLIVIGFIAYRFGFLRKRPPLYAHMPIAGVYEDPFDYTVASQRFAKQATKVLNDGLKKYDSIFQVITGTGPRLVVPPKYVDEIKNNRQLSFANEIAKQSLAHHPGFETFRSVLASEIFQDTIKKKITQSLNQITEGLSEEADFALGRHLGDSKEWHEVNVGQLSLDIIARLSTRVFLGEDYCRNEAWLGVSLGYTKTAMRASQALYTWPEILRPLAARFLPITKELRATLSAARALLEPDVARRRQSRLATLRRGEEPLPGKDALDWMDEVADGRAFDVVLGQLLLTVVAILTTSGLFAEVLLDLAAHPEYLPTLRSEVVEVLQETGWRKTALHKLKQMDSFIKESQRMTPSSIVTIRRRAEVDVKLSDGTVLPKGSSIMMPIIGNMRNPKVYNQPEQFDAWRFFNMRTSKESEAKAQLTTPSADHMGFGLGQHACPGRFLAANEIKTALCHMLLKYEWRFPDGKARPGSFEWETELLTNPMATFQIRRREEEMLL